MFVGEGYSEWYKQRRADVILEDLARNIEINSEREEEAERIPVILSSFDYYKWRMTRINAERRVKEAVSKFWKTHKTLKNYGLRVRPSHRDYLKTKKYQ